MIVESILGKLVDSVAGKATSMAVKAAWRLLRKHERIVYDGRRGILSADVQGRGGYLYSSGKKSSGRAEGHVSCLKGVINLTRDNTDGSYELVLQRLGKRKNRQQLEPDPNLSKRFLVFRFEAKVQGGNHTLRPVLHDPADWKWLGDNHVVIKSLDWQPYELSVSFDPTRPAEVRIDDRDVAKVGSSVQIRRLLVTEAVT